jgi:hypothetical protein
MDYAMAFPSPVYLELLKGMVRIKTSSRIQRFLTGGYSQLGLSYRPASPCILTGRYDNPMPEST